MPPSYLAYMDDPSRLPSGLERIAYDADRQVYTFRDRTSGQRWEGEPGNTYGRLHTISETPAYFNSERHLSVSSSSSSSAPAAPESSSSPSFSSSSYAPESPPMTTFPTTWDPPANYETAELPSAKRIAAQFSTLRKSVFRKQRRGSGAEEKERERGRERAASVVEKGSPVQADRASARARASTVSAGTIDEEPKSVFEW